MIINQTGDNYDDLLKVVDKKTYLIGSDPRAATCTGTDQSRLEVK